MRIPPFFVFLLVLEDKTMLSLGAHIKYLRQNLGMTQKALAQTLGVSPQAVSKWENDLSYPDILLLPQLASALNVGLDTLLSPCKRDIIS